MNFTLPQLLWAAQHDWFVFGDRQFITGNSYYGDGSFQTVTFTSFEALRDWAGY